MLDVYSFCIMSICNFGCFSFRFRGSNYTNSWSLLTLNVYFHVGNHITLSVHLLFEFVKFHIHLNPK